MKKVLSVLLAAAMVMGKSVSVFADKEWGKGPKDAEGSVLVNELTFNPIMDVVFTDKHEEHVNCETVMEDEFFFHPGDVAYFELQAYKPKLEWTITAAGKKAAKELGVDWKTAWETPDARANKKEREEATEVGQLSKDKFWKVVDNGSIQAYTGPIDANWAIYIKDHSSYIKSAEFAVRTVGGKVTDETSVKYVKITFQDSYDELDSDDADFYFYVADTTLKTHGMNKWTSEYAEVHYLFDNWVEKFVEFDWINDVEFDDTRWVTRAGKEGKGTAAFSFNNEAYYVVKMNPEEEVVFNFSNDYDKALDKAYGYDADIESYNFKGTKDSFNRVGDVIIPADDDTFVYEVVDGKAVEVEAEYVEDYEVIKGTKVDGWVIETNELGYYIVSDIELEIEAEEVEAEPEVEADKANPETGAADFVGAAVAMAVVSVAAAGALALKK